MNEVDKNEQIFLYTNKEEPEQNKTTKLVKYVLILILGIGIGLIALAKYTNYIDNYLKYMEPIKVNAQRFKNDGKNVDRITIKEAYNIKKEASILGYLEEVEAKLEIPSVNIEQNIYKGANQYTLAMGVATDIYEDAQIGRGNYVLAGHNFMVGNIYLDNLDKIEKDSYMYVTTKTHRYKYKVIKTEVNKGTYMLINGKPKEDTIFALPKGKQKPLLTVYTCVGYEGYDKFVAQGELVDVVGLN